MPSSPYSSPLAEALAADVRDRLVRYARIDTQSARDRDGTPSTPGQWDLARLLEQELTELGLDDVRCDEHAYVYATLPGAAGAPVIGLLAHVDTSPDAPGAGVEPIVHADYDGGAISLPKDGTVLDPAAMPELASRVGHELVTGSGDTLLGADDKAGVAEIMAAVAHLVAHPELPRPTLRIAFTPDEEIGLGAHGFDVEGFGARCAYTLDGSEPGELQDETFSGVAVTVTIDGVDVHPGLAKGKLVNATRLAGRLLDVLPADLTPEATDSRAGFLHAYEVDATAGRATLRFIARDYDDDKLAGHVALLRAAAEGVVGAEPRARLTFDAQPQYPNMHRFIAPHPEISALAEAAIRAEGLEPVRTAIRGGTDGSILSARGLPTPNLFTGGHEFHSVREWASVHEMASAAAVVVRLAERWAADG